METNNETPGAEFKEFIDSRIIEIIDDTIQKIRDILDQVEGLVHEIWDIIQIIAALVHEARNMFRGEKQAEPALA